MTPFDRRVRAEIYSLFLTGRREVAAHDVASSLDSELQPVLDSLARLHAEHRLSVEADGRVVMAHPFSGVETPYRAAIEPHWWYANCAWDALALHALVGEGRTEGPNGLVWEVRDGVVTPEGLVHLLVPAVSFWEDVGFTWANIHGFRSEAELDEWLEQTGSERGYVARAQTMYEFSKDWYADRFSEGWDPLTPERAAEIMARHGLTGDFWSLR